MPENDEKRMGIVLKAVYGVILVGVVAIVIGGKIPAIGKRFVASESVGQGGDLYRLCDLDQFRERITFAKQKPPAPLEDAEILTLGDSFFNSSLGSDLFANELAGRGGFPVHNLPAGDFFEPYSYPIAFLNAIGYKPERRRILILETVERSSLERTGTYLASIDNKLTSAGTLTNRINALAFRMLKNNDVIYFFEHNLLIHPVSKWLKNVRFRWFDIIDESIGAYTIRPPMLFYNRDIQFASTSKSDAVLNAASAKVEQLALTLRSRYKLDLIYVVIPDKYSVYRDYLDKERPYDRYIPRLVRMLRGRGVHAVDLYSAYMNYRRTGTDLLYYGSDTHYTGKGKVLLVDECMREIETIRGRRLSKADVEKDKGHPQNEF
jgi:hypothetical protein